jgi:hypothetical protein
MAEPALGIGIGAATTDRAAKPLSSSAVDARPFLLEKTKSGLFSGSERQIALGPD